MKKKSKQLVVVQQETHVLDIPLKQILLDPNQPRETFDEESLTELAGSIESQGLQQLPVVNFAYRKDGKDYYYIKAGERRFRAHSLLKKSTMRCIVDGTYDGKFDINRKLAQAAENSSREPHTHAEIVRVMEEVVKDESSKRPDKPHGTIEIAMGKVSKAFGKSRSWAINYYTLTHLHPELRMMLDHKDDGERLNFSIALALSRIPSEQQQELLSQAKKLKEKGGHALMYSFIVRQAQSLQKSHGIIRRNRKPSDDKAVLTTTIERLYRHGVAFCAERHSSEHRAYMQSVVDQMSTLEVDGSKHKLKEAILVFQDLLTLMEERRDFLYRNLRVVANR